MRLLRFHELPVSPWRNGGGVTRELAALGGAGGDLLWRLSIATVNADGPFSTFNGSGGWLGGTPGPTRVTSIV